MMFARARHWPSPALLESNSHTHILFRVHFVIVLHLRLGLSKLIFYSYFLIETANVFFMHPLCATYSGNLVPLDLITLITFSEEYNLWRPSLYKYLYICLTSLVAYVKTFSSPLYSKNNLLVINFRYQLTDSMEQGPSWILNSSSSGRSLRLLQNPKFYYSFRKHLAQSHESLAHLLWRIMHCWQG
jgi:hypothetical protein